MNMTRKILSYFQSRRSDSFLDKAQAAQRGKTCVSSTATTSENEGRRRAWVVFSGQTDLPWLRLLKPGFRHCFVLINDGTNWLTIDPRSPRTDITVHTVPLSFNLPLWLSDRGNKVVKTELQDPQTPAPWMVFSCVEAVKRVLGLHNRWIITPWQLYRHLTSKNTVILNGSVRTGEISQRKKQDSGLYRNDETLNKGDLSWEA